MERAWIALTACVLLATGCTSLAERIAEPRSASRLGRFVETTAQALSIRQGEIRARAGNRVFYRVVDPGDYHLQFDYARSGDGFKFNLKLKPPAARREQTGTVVYLHGWGEDHSSMLAWAMSLANFGYQGILPDLRNHGGSDRAPAGYGPREARDIADLIASLDASGKLQRPLFLFGVSYGGTVAVLASMEDAIRPDAVIAMEPMIVAGDGIRGMIAGMRATRPSGMVERMARAWTLDRYDDRGVERAIADAGERLRLDLDTLTIGPVLRAPELPCTLLLQGGQDEFFDPVAARAYADAPRVRYLELPQEIHLTLPMRVDVLAEPLASWLRNAETCPMLALPSTYSPAGSR